MKIISATITFFLLTKLTLADTYEFEASGKVISNDSIELKKGFDKSIIVNELYDVVLKEAGFDEWGQPKRNCPNPDIDEKELEQRAWDLYKKEGALALPDDDISDDDWL